MHNDIYIPCVLSCLREEDCFIKTLSASKVMALDKKVSPDLRTAFSPLERSDPLPSSPVTSNKGSGSATPLPSQATDLLDALTKLYTHGSWHTCRSLKDGDNASSPDLLPFNIGACTLIRLCDHIKQWHDLNFYAWFEDKLR